MSRIYVILIVGLILLTATVGQAGLHPSYSYKAEIDTVPFYTGGQYDPDLPEPNDYTRYPVGHWPQRYSELVRFIEAIAEKSGRAVMETHGESYEGRALYHVFVSSEDNIARMDEIKEAMAALADPRKVSNPAELDELIDGMPAVAWLGYSIHGDELSGVDAAAQLIYHLAAGNDQATLDILDNVFIIIDPIQNPDGRERYLSLLDTYRSRVPNYDKYALQHRGSYPWGRSNHYLFDLNRDYILLRQAETQGRVRTIVDWHPQLVVDAHEMGSDASYLFSPPRQPINYNTPERVMKWYDKFNEGQAAAFDDRGWAYYSGEWNEQWYPGYGSAWATHMGAVGILYEMAGVDGQFVRQRDNYLLTYHEAVNKQFTSSLANLETAATNREELLRDYHQTRKDVIYEGQRSGLTFLFEPDTDEIKTARFIETLVKLGIEVKRTTSSFTVKSATGMYGDRNSNKGFEAGTYVVSTAQPNGALAKAILEFDPRLNLEFLNEERREIEKHDATRMYETSSWSLPLAYDIESYFTTTAPSVNTELVGEIALSAGKLVNPDAEYGFVVDMVGEKTFLLLNRLFAEDLVIYCSRKEFSLAGKTFKPGSLVLRTRGNPDNLSEILSPLATEIGIDVLGVNSGKSSEGSFLGAPTFELLKTPKVALVTGNGISHTSFGSLWYTIDLELGVPHSLLALSDLNRVDLSRYNVLVLPSSWGPLASSMTAGSAGKIRSWVEDGGTLICMGESAVWAADTSSHMSGVRLKRQVLDRLDEFTLALNRELAAESPVVDTVALWNPEKAKKTEDEEPGKPTSTKDATELDEWQRRFFPRGVYMRANLDSEHWLSFGMKDKVPASIYGSYAFMASKPVSAVARFASENDLRLSGLLWPEARERTAQTLYASRERKGKGQIVLFAGDPNFRAFNYGTRTMFVTAMLYGPGLGSRAGGPYEY